MADSSQYDDATLARRYAMAQKLMESGRAPIKHWAEGLGNLAESALGGYQFSKAEDERRAERAQGKADLAGMFGLPAPVATNEPSSGGFQKLAALLSGSGAAASAPAVAAPAGPDQASYPPPPAAPPAPTTFRPGITAPTTAAAPPTGAPDYGKAIAGIESGGAYDKLGPQTKTGDRAFGKYQVMGNNIPEWTTQVLGKPMTPEQFLANPDAQESVFKAKFGDYVQKYGPEGAAKAWFAGEKGMNNPNAKDVLGTTVAGYGQKFTQALGPQSPTAAPQMAAALTAPSGDATLPPGATPAQGALPTAEAVRGAAPTPGGPLANVPLEVRQQIAAGMNSRNPAAQQIAQALLQQAISNKATYQTTPDGDILQLDPSGRAQPKVVYQAQPKPIAVPENSQLWDPRTKTFIGGGPAAIPTSVPGPGGAPIPVPPGLSPKDAKEFTKRITETSADAAAGKMTETQSDSQRYGNLMEEAEANFKGLEKQSSGISGAAQTIAGKIPVVGAVGQSEDFQNMEQSKSQWIAAKLRRESGATISPSEYAQEDKRFFPQPGNTQKVIEQKAEARRVATEGMKKGAGPGYKPPNLDKTKAEPVTKSIGGKEYYQENGQWFEK